MSWSLSRNGRAVDLVNPRVEDVDFLEIADTLAHVYRWTGSAKHDVSVAWHTIIGVEIARWRKLDHAIPHWLLHDAHEARLGDIATPVAEAYATVIASRILFGVGEAAVEEIRRNVRSAQAEMKGRHDYVLQRAAGLEGPFNLDVALAVKEIDRIALMTERRDYLPTSPRRWDEGLESVPTFPRALGPPPTPAVCSERLYQLFRQHLPALGGQAAA
jgi:5'-deoxynucleotidase YfbR-like HD superfamily hydrolase